ncbi:MAG TPA: VOC family protein [Mycobacterium sp.]|nr:VOC family protein [Mycobacterium sp.]
MSQSPGDVSEQSGDAAPDGQAAINIRVASSLIRVSHLLRSVTFYCDVFGFHVALREQDMALLVSPSGFQLYLNAIDPSRRHDRGTIGVEFLMWATDSRYELDTIVRRLRAHDPAVFTRTENDVTFVEGCDPDKIRVVVAYPSPDQLPRQVIASILRG